MVTLLLCEDLYNARTEFKLHEAARAETIFHSNILRIKYYREGLFSGAVYCLVKWSNKRKRLKFIPCTLGLRNDC